ncbi:homoaconitate hydratase family protein [bacterium]|nr:homoaconitate hydratase family protein [bacterium]
MPHTIIEKIFLAHGAEGAEPGSIQWLGLDYRTARDFGGASVVQNLRENVPDKPVADVKRTFFTFDCNAPANTAGYADNQHSCRLFAREHGVKVFDVDAGIGSHVLIESGLVKPGTTAVGTDSHYNILGALGAFGQGMGDVDIAYAFAHGRTWFEVPGSVKITLKGLPAANTDAKDVTLYLCGQLGAAGLLGQVGELYGEWVDQAGLAERITLASMGTEMGAISLIIPGDNPDFHASPGAPYERELEFDIDGLRPQVALPGHPEDVHPVHEVIAQGSVPIDSVFIGSCTNGRIEDLRAAASHLRGGACPPQVMLRVVPATRQVWQEALKEGLMDVFMDANGLVSNAGCGGCASGQIGMTGAGEVQLSTSNRNFSGKQGKGRTYLCGPSVAAASAAAGELVEPEAKS